uniref:Uncharacterized protein n=1 Tax=Rhizophora mucronata TaxID=61149 RepID=A0A2P2JU74_RHIMU
MLYKLSLGHPFFVCIIQAWGPFGPPHCGN